MKKLFYVTLFILTTAFGFGGCGTKLPPSELDFTKQIPETIARSSIFKLDSFIVWGADMVRTDDGICHLVFSHWPKSLGFQAWVTHSMIGYATSENPEGPYTYKGVLLPPRGKEYWDGYMTHNPSIIQHNEKFYLYYNGTHGEGDWGPKKKVVGDDRWTFRMNQRVGVAVADHPAGPWERFDKPLLDVGEYGEGLVSTPCAEVTPENKILLYFKTQLPGEGEFMGGVFHYPSMGDSGLGPFEKYDRPLVNKNEVFPDTFFHFHIDDHEEWFQGDRYYAIVKDHDAPYLTEYGRILYLMESPDGLNWKLSNHLLVKDQSVQWDSGELIKYRRLEMPKIYKEDGVPRVLFLAALEDDDSDGHSYNIAIPLSRK